ncbi:hypothetical protein [Dysgonomonas sp. BGC7]|uniref:hypothetical protein n=1 Tax=Dysgonomonas sp. BGC7 TaxID=1658008 RepID=UPI000683012D|nr:hypothetical protein [Dysgonomonas sp. BGC7]MBD8390109.1 hypothetical protein [Dysgonomonas sp. BGC7]
MKLFIYCLTLLLAIIITTSCENESIKLYHPKPDEEEKPIEWLLETVDYPEAGLGFIRRNDLKFLYDDNYSLQMINNTSDAYNVDYKKGKIAFSRKTEASSYITYDSLILKLDENDRAIYGLHTTYRDMLNEKDANKVQDDSMRFSYDSQGYLIKLDRYAWTGYKEPSYTEEYTIKDGNIVEIITHNASYNFKYSFFYNESEYTQASRYCFEMMHNTVSLTSGNGCLLLTNLVFMSDYLGKKSKNNVIRVLIERVVQGKAELYAEVQYDYKYDENNLLTQVTLNGIVNNNDIPEGYTISFGYQKKGEDEKNPAR